MNFKIFTSVHGLLRFGFSLGLLAAAALTAGVAAPAFAADAPAASPAPAAKAADVPTSPAKTAALPAVAPAEFKVKFELSNGTIVAAFHKSWAPLGVQRIYDLVNAKFFDGARFFRVVPDFVVQFGIAGDPALDAKWTDNNLKDEPVLKPNAKGTITFAKSSRPNSRSTQLFINLKDNSGSLDPQGFSTLGEIVEGMDVVQKISGLYGEMPDQGKIHSAGNAYLNTEFPKMDYIKKATIELL